MSTPWLLHRCWFISGKLSSQAEQGPCGVPAVCRSEHFRELRHLVVSQGLPWGDNTHKDRWFWCRCIFLFNLKTATKTNTWSQFSAEVRIANTGSDRLHAAAATCAEKSASGLITSFLSSSPTAILIKSKRRIQLGPESKSCLE